MSAYPIQELGPSNAVALTSCETPTTLTQVPYSAVAWAVPGCVLMAAVAAANWAAVGPWSGPLLCWTWTGTVAARDWASRALFSEECSPIAKITAVAPNAIAASVTAVPAGLANGAARPRTTGGAAARGGRAPGGDRRDGGQPAGPQRRAERGQQGDGEHAGGREQQRPEGHLLAADGVRPGRLVQDGGGEQVTADDACEAAG